MGLDNISNEVAERWKALPPKVKKLALTELKNHPYTNSKHLNEHQRSLMRQLIDAGFVVEKAAKSNPDNLDLINSANAAGNPIEDLDNIYEYELTDERLARMIVFTGYARLAL